MQETEDAALRVRSLFYLLGNFEGEILLRGVEL